MSYSGLDKKGVMIANKTSIMGTDDYSPVVSPYFRGLLERFIVVDRQQRIGVNDVEIRAITARHSEPNSLGFKFFAPEFTLTYSGDTVYSEDIVEQYKDSNILVLNVPSRKRTESNLCMEDATKIIDSVKPNLAIITHFGQEMVKEDPMYEVREIQRQTKVQAIAARDGMAINPSSYSLSGQKTLQKFK